MLATLTLLSCFAPPTPADVRPTAPLQRSSLPRDLVERRPEESTILDRGGDPEAQEERGRIRVEARKPAKTAPRSAQCLEIASAFESGWVESFPPALLYSGGRATYSFWRENTEPIEVTIHGLAEVWASYLPGSSEPDVKAPPRQVLCLIASNVGTFVGTDVEGLHLRDAERRDHILMFPRGPFSIELRQRLAAEAGYATHLAEPAALLVTIYRGATFTPLEDRVRTTPTPRSQPIP